MTDKNSTKNDKTAAKAAAAKTATSAKTKSASAKKAPKSAPITAKEDWELAADAPQIEAQPAVLREAERVLAKWQSQVRKASLIAVGLVATLALVSILTSVITISSLGSRNETFMTVSSSLSERVATLNSGLASFDAARAQLMQMQEQIESLALKIEENQLGYASTEADIEVQLAAYKQDVNAEIVSQTESLRASFAGLDEKFMEIDERFSEFSATLEASGQRVERVGAQAQQLASLSEMLNALLTLEQEKYLEVLRSQSAGIGSGSPSASSQDRPFFERNANR